MKDTLIVVPNMIVINEVVSGTNNDDGQKSGFEGHIVEGDNIIIRCSTAAHDLLFIGIR